MESTLISLLFYTSLLGLVMGYVVNKTNFCTMGAVSDLVNIGDSSRLKSWMLAAIVAVIGVNLSQMFGLFDVSESRIPYTNSLFFWPRYVLGGLLFGIGMTYASGCGNKVLIRLGGGNLKSLFVLITAGAMAYLMTRTDFYGIVFHSWMQPISPDLASFGINDQSLPSILNFIIPIVESNTFSIIFGLVIPIVLMIYFFADGKFNNFDHILSGFVVGIVVTLAWFLTGGSMGQEWIETNNFLDNPYPGVGVQSFTFINPMAETMIYVGSAADSYYLTFGVTALISVIIGSFIYAMISKSFRIEWFVSSNDFLRHLFGAVLIGIGGVLSLGCTIGQGVTGISTLALGSFITLASILLGAVITMKIEYYNAVYEECSFIDSLFASLADIKLIPEKFRRLDKI